MDDLFGALLHCMALVFEEDDDGDPMYTLFWGAQDVGNYAISVRRPTLLENVDHFGGMPEGYKVH